MDYNEIRENMTSDKVFWDAWDFCEKEFGSRWRGIKLDTKRKLAIEKYENLCRLKEIEPYKG